MNKAVQRHQTISCPCIIVTPLCHDDKESSFDASYIISSAVRVRSFLSENWCRISVFKGYDDADISCDPHMCSWVFTAFEIFLLVSVVDLYTHIYTIVW